MSVKIEHMIDGMWKVCMIIYLIWLDGSTIALLTDVVLDIDEYKECETLCILERKIITFYLRMVSVLDLYL